MTARLLLALLLAFATTAGAERLYLGNLAPASPPTGLRIEVGPHSVVLGYGEFATIELEPGGYRPAVLDPVSGQEQAFADLLWRPADSITPVLYVAAAEDGPYRVVVDFDVAADGSTPGAQARPTRFVVHHEASARLGGEVRELRLEARCGGSQSGFEVPPTVEFADLTFGARWRDPVGSIETVDCDVIVAGVAVGGFSLRLEMAPETRTRRAFLIGDGESRALRILVVDGAEVVAVADPEPPAPRALADSTDHWFDLLRPDQGLTLFEVGGTGVVFGTWFTVGTDNLPAWFYFEGVKVQGIGRRDITVYAGSRAPGAASLNVVGSARMQYLDCNEVEFRVLLGASDFRSVRARRSRSVTFCPVFD